MTDTVDPFADARAAMLDAFSPENLDPELQKYLYISDLGWHNIKHPLVYSIGHAPPLNKLMNKNLRDKKEAVAKAKAAGDWETVVWLHERPWRVHAFNKIKSKLPDERYWKLLGDIWVDSENIPQEVATWNRLLKSKRPGREYIMQLEERWAFTQLEDNLTIYQGHTTDRMDGWSWTLRRSTAEWFAKRFADIEDSKPVVSRGVARKSDVLAFFTRRNEDEVLINPDRVVIT